MSTTRKPKPPAPDTFETAAVYKDLLDQPGHLFRRGEQICVSAYYDALGTAITPMQYGALRMVHEHPGLDQVTLARALALDTSTTAEIATRLERKGLLRRELLIVKRRQRLLYLTEEGASVLVGVVRAVNQLRGELLSRLEPDEREDLMRLLRRFVEVNADRSRVPAEGPDSASPLKVPPK
jgi:DNA-binding MarR family transcriptional regulator